MLLKNCGPHKSRDKSYGTMGMGLDIIYMNYPPVSRVQYEGKIYPIYVSFLSQLMGLIVSLRSETYQL